MSKDMITKSSRQKGKRSIIFENKPYILASACAGGSKEAEGPLGYALDLTDTEDLFGGKSWEEAESRMQAEVAKLALKKAELSVKDIRYLIGGDLLGQLIATSFGIEGLEIPLLGVYGACSTFGEAIITASFLLDAGFANKAMAITSSHFAGAEKQFRFPLSYGNQRPPAASWTVTGGAALVLAAGNTNGHTYSNGEIRQHSETGNGSSGFKSRVSIAGACIGKIVDYGIKDSMNMGACMAPAVVIIGL